MLERGQCINRMMKRMMKLFRREPLLGLALTLGLIESALGGWRDRPALLSLGLGFLGMAVGIRLWQLQHRSPKP